LYRDVREEFKRDFPDTYLTNSFLKISKTDGESLFELLTTFSEIFQYIIKQINDQNKENHKLRDIVLMYDQLLWNKEMYDLQ